MAPWKFQLKSLVPHCTQRAQVSLVTSLYLGAGTTQNAAGAAVGGSAVILGGVPKDTLQLLTDDLKPLKNIVTRPEAV